MLQTGLYRLASNKIDISITDKSLMVHHVEKPIHEI
jgi:hypothetical protein